MGRGGEGIGELVPRNVVHSLKRPGGVVVLLVEQPADGCNLLEESKRTCVPNKLSKGFKRKKNRKTHTEEKTEGKPYKIRVD